MDAISIISAAAPMYEEGEVIGLTTLAVWKIQEAWRRIEFLPCHRHPE